MLRGLYYNILLVMLFVHFCIGPVFADFDRQQVIKLVRKAGLGDELDAGVKIVADEQGVLGISDQGNYFMQYIVRDPNQGGNCSIDIADDVELAENWDKAVIVTHGWIDKGKNDWPRDMAVAIEEKVDSKKWLCGYFDWKGGAAVVSPVEAAKYAKFVAGPRLANSLLSLKGAHRLKHVHLIGHSAGSWGVNAAAEIIAAGTNAQVHITFLDAYVPPDWDKGQLGNICDDKTRVWAEHYYSRDITAYSTQEDLVWGHNVDLTKVDPGIKQHEFPYHWYYATITGKYRKKDRPKRHEIYSRLGDIEYGFGRSLEAGADNWQKSKELERGNKAVKITRPKKKGWFGIKY